MADVAPRPWRLWKAGERSEVPHIADADGRVIARAEGNIWVWQDFIAPLILAAIAILDEVRSVENEFLNGSRKPGDPEPVGLLSSPATLRPGFLEVGVSEDETEVIINHPDLQADAAGVGHIAFSPQQAISFAQTVLKLAHSCKRRL